MQSKVTNTCKLNDPLKHNNDNGINYLQFGSSKKYAKKCFKMF